LGWPGIDADHPDREVLRLVALALHNGRTGLFDRNLIQTQRVRAASAGAWTGRFGGMFVVDAAPRDGQMLADAEALVREQVQRLCDGDLDEARLRSTMLNLEVGELRGLEENGSRVSRMAGAFVTRRSWADVEGTLDRMRALTRDDVVAAAGRHLAGPPLVAWRQTGEPTRPSLEVPAVAREPLPERRSKLFEALAANDESPWPPQVLQEGVDYERASTPWGRRVRNRNPFSALSQVGFRWLTGMQEQRGLGTRFALWAKSGIVDGPTRTGFLEAVHDRAAGVHASVGRYHVDLVVRAPAEHLEEVLALAGRRMEAPSIPLQERAAHVADAVRSRRQRRSTRSFAALALRAYARHGEGSALLSLRLPDDELLALADADGGEAVRRVVYS
jgi:predicted Zn-dependent peptidase